MATIKGVWMFKETVDISNRFHYLVNFASNGIQYNRILVAPDDDDYQDSLQYGKPYASGFMANDIYGFVPGTGVSWWDEDYRIVDFGESEQTVTDAFYTWLTANATPQETEPEEPSTTLKDLTNTTWIIPAGWTATAGYGAFDDLSFNLKINDEDCGSFGILRIGYYGNEVDWYSRENSIAYSLPSEITNDNSFTLTFDNCADATNSDLITWLTENGELQGEEEKPTLTYDLTKLNLTAGTYSIIIVAKAAGYNDAPSNTVQFVVEQESFVEETNEYGTTMVINKYTEEPNEYGTTMIIGGETTTNLISFTIAGTTYQAEEGMTWAQWVDSEYNTDEYNCPYGNTVYTKLGASINAQGGDVIVAGKAYIVTGNND